MLKAIHVQVDKASARQKSVLVAKKLRAMKQERIASFVETSMEETLSYMDFPNTGTGYGQITVSNAS